MRDWDFKVMKVYEFCYRPRLLIKVDHLKQYIPVLLVKLDVFRSHLQAPAPPHHAPEAQALRADHVRRGAGTLGS